MNRVGTDALEHIAQIGERIDVVALAGGDQAAQYCRRVSAVVAPKERPVATTHRHPAQAALRAVMPRTGLCRARSDWRRHVERPVLPTRHKR